MKKIALVALPLALGLVACDNAAEEPVDGTDTTAMEPAPVEPMATGTTDPMMDDTMTDDTMTDDMADDTMADDMGTETPAAEETPM
ncbi:hypothetical protein [Qipengyuania sp. MTN3-11]|uniref:hypothetical protein n=1 Tax=Qipengyuania sp. MTN3-11 TaxID=3056557 RepID=UPI0036F243B4